MQREPKVKIRRDAARKFGFNAELNNSHEMGLLKGAYLSIKSVFSEINWEVFFDEFYLLTLSNASLKAMRMLEIL